MLNRNKGDLIIARPPFQLRRPVQKGPRVNDQITADEVRVVGAAGQMLGVMSVAQAIEAAEEEGLDLVEVSPGAVPPVCKILDYGKYKYEQQKKANEARKKQKTVDVKEIKVRPTIGEHDYAVKIRNARRFLEDENKVKVTLRLRGRELAHKDLVMDVLNRIRNDLADLSKVDLEPKLEGRQAVMVLSADLSAGKAAGSAEEKKSEESVSAAKEGAKAEE